jgi:3',5'-cyclic-AMP phosphodiesterase
VCRKKFVEEHLMPIHVPPISRRSFLRQSVVATASLAVLQTGWGAEPGDPHFFALLADTHIPERADVVARDVNMTGNLRHVVGQLCALGTTPAGVIINGDCAYLRGLPDDYANLAQCVAPLAEAGLSLHLTMGNHDDRGPCFDALSDQRSSISPVESKHVSVVESPHANLFLLDSLQEVNVVTGELGQAQLDWLGKALDERDDKPAVVIAHHNPQFTPPPEGNRWSGIQDSAEFFELISSKKQVKAYVFGHTHDWSISQRDGIHLINLPPVAYVFAAGKANGWVGARLRPDGIELALQTIDPDHPRNGERVELNWA